jgi:hypothetical protein
MIKPTVGRVVLYTPLPQMERTFPHEQPFAAIITYVWNDGLVNLLVMRDDGATFPKTSVPLVHEGEPAQGQCGWMPYQKGQAAKTEAAEAKVSGATGTCFSPATLLTDAELAIAMAARSFPRVTEDVVNGVIVKDDYAVIGTLTVCVLTLRNGFNVVGQSACVDPRNFDEAIGRTYARKNAVQQIWQLEGYALAERVRISSENR